MIHQFHEEHHFDYQRVADGLKLMTWGLFKKAVIADRLASLVNYPYTNPYLFSGPELALATLYFAVQIYCDFSGYSDIAIGAAQVLGFKLMTNFKRPYLALSVSEFWTRWHISLSTWFKDYVYIPLGGNRVSRWHWHVNILIVFLVSGLWHGASWTYVIWGGLHGIYLVGENYLQGLWIRVPEKIRGALPARLIRPLQRFFVLALVCYGWIFFRAASLESSAYIAMKVFTGWNWNMLAELARSIATNYSLLITFGAIAVMEVVHYFQERGSIRAALARKPAIFRRALYVGILVCIIIFGRIYEVPTNFIYFQF
jgi:D-alanyl-lipoteichoic acid acyltransferase DltB (MBOAT superfamily)